MGGIDSQLYNYIINNLSAISDEWLTYRKESIGSIYSIDVDKSIESLLSEQNRFTNLTIASILLHDKKIFSENKKEWALNLAKNWVSTNTPIHEVLNSLSNARKAYWTFVERFVESKKEEISHRDLLKWGIVIHSAFDELTIKFSETYYLMMNNKFNVQQSLIEELGSPIILITPEVGILPLIGDIDMKRAKIVMKHVPEKCVKADITNLFIDLSGVPIVDSMVIHQIYELIKVLKLLGIKSTITGIRPEIAQSASQLGINFSDIDSFSSLQLAFKKGI